MTIHTWGRSKSDFNHAWLKNRFIVSLSKARKVLEGAVKDDEIGDDLEALFAEWPLRKAEAQKLLDDHLQAASPREQVTKILGTNLDSELTDWLAELAHRRWAEAVKPDVRVTKAKEALASLDAQVQLFVKSTAHVKLANAGDKAFLYLIELQSAAVSVGMAFSALGNGA